MGENMAKKINVNGITLAYKEFGSGDKYLISTQNFFLDGCHMELLGKKPYDYHVFLIYMRGYGESDHIYNIIPRDYVKVWGEDIIAFAKAMEMKSFYYTGVSHGCFAGWYIAFHRPELLRGFVPTSGITQFNPEIVSNSQIKQINPDEVVGNMEALDKMAWKESDPTSDPKRIARRKFNHINHLEILMNRKKEEFTIVNTGMSGSDAASEAEFYDQLSKIPVPVMIINGIKDPLSTVEKALRVAKIIPGAELLTYQNLGHGGPDEYPELIARDCDRFFKDIEGRIL
jgi:pimeloyl-ACP methyl ester carboxylesterase